jgi:kynurenine formamidase
MPNVHPLGFVYMLTKRHGDPESFLPEMVQVFHASPKTTSSASGTIVMSDHTGTHIDALCHVALGRKLNGGVDVTSQIETPSGFLKNGIERMQPIVGRGILLDVAAAMGADYLPKSYRISRRDLEESCSRENVQPMEGDAVLVRTGYGRFWNEQARYFEAASVSFEATKWLSDKGVAAVGADNTDWEGANGTADPTMGVTLPCHALLMVEKGIPIIEHMNLESLSRDRVYEFLFVCAPLKLRGATGSPVRPVGIVEGNGRAAQRSAATL